MAIPPWKAPEEVQQLLSGVKNKHHSPRLDYAKISVAFDDSKAFKNDTINWGKTIKFTNLHKLWHKPDVFDFAIIVPSDLWHNLLEPEQKEPYLDLHLTRCQVEYEPEVVVENKKKVKIKDEHGRVKYTDKIKFDDDGNPKWRLAPLDLWAFTQNVKRYGSWCYEIMEFNKTASGKKFDGEEAYLMEEDDYKCEPMFN